MFHKYKKIGLTMLGLGAGMLCACLFQSGFACALVGAGLLIVGIILIRKC